MSLLDDIRADLVDESAGISNTLRKAKILASELGVPEFREWVDFELAGYPSRENVPDYRRFNPTNLGTFSGPFGSGVKNFVIPTYALPDDVKNFAENLIFYDGVGSLEAQAAIAGEALQMRWPQEMVMLARDSIHMSGDLLLADAHRQILPHMILGILDQVKNKLLDFLLGLQESNITADNLDQNTVERDVVRNLFNINIYGDRNVVASGEHVAQSGTNVQEGDLESLLTFLRELNVDTEDIEQIRDAISSEPNASNGPKVQAWRDSMIGKAASGKWNIALATASKLLPDALNAYYG